MEIFKGGIKLSGSLIVAAIISFFLCISMLNISSALFTSEVGYDAYVYIDENENAKLDEDEKIHTQYNYEYPSDGKTDDLMAEEYEDKGYSINKVKIRTPLTGIGKAFFLLITQSLSLIMIIAFAGHSVYNIGFKDSNLVRIGSKKKDILKGLKIGLVGNVPFFILFILIIVAACGAAPKIPTLWYASLNSHFYAVITGVSSGTELVSQLDVWQYIIFFLLQLIVPAIAAIGYVLGFKEIRLSEKIMYKKEDK